MAIKPQETIQGELIIIPDPLVPIRQIHFRSDSATGRFGIYVTHDGAKTFLPLLLAPSADQGDRPGSFLTLGDDYSAEWVHNPVLAERARVAQFRGVPIPLSAAHISTLYTGALLGIFRSPRGRVLRATEMHLTVQTPADQDILVEIVDSVGNPLPNAGNNWIGRIANGQRTGLKQFNTPLTFSDGSNYKLKINQCGTVANPGEVLEVRLVCELVS